MPTFRSHRRTADLVVAGTAVVVSAAVILQIDAPWLRWCDGRLFELLNRLPDDWYRVMWAAQLPGVLGAPLLVAVVVMWWRFRLALGLAALVPMKLVVEYDVLKTVVHQQRPGAVMPGAIVRNVPAAGQAFPSGHAVILFGMAMLASPYLGRHGNAVV
ncbi:MAG: phosphatase PAP2 family protein, partial [Mycobacteriaceae bacterium]|nr:phosphatase PAP2 family protein [Mycobacteriaceae bacterium]